MESKKPQKGKRLTFSAIPIKKVAPGAIAPPEELLATSLTQIVPTMFNRRGAPEVKKAAAPPSRSKTAKIKRPNIGQKQYELAAAEEPEIVSIAAPEAVVPEAVIPEGVAPEAVVPEAVAPEAVAPQPIKIRRPKSKYSQKLKKVKETIDEIENNDPYKEVPEAFVSQSRKGFTSFVVKTYGDFALPPKLQAPDMEACSRLGAAGEDTTRMYLYQQFVREYVRQASPYRGTLVYHGLGSGKTCSAIAAMEALYGTSGKKIIVMTPFSLQNNFLTEITFCGFKHFRLQNHWVRIELESDPTAALFAKEVMKIPDTFFQKQKRAKRTMAFYVPDFEQPANFDSLPDTDKKEIRDQIFSILRQRITFISYNGIRASQLKIWACSQPDFFDDAVIIIDEVHNLTRLMQGTIEPYLMETPRQKRRIEAEPVTPGRWTPKLCNVSANYKRAFLFYRLLVGAKNSKILALSGTPIVNFPEELGILANVLHGYNDCVEATIPQNPSIPAARIEALFNTTAANHPRIDFYKITQTQSAQQIFISAVPEGYRKVFDASGKLQGLEHVGGDAVPASIEDIFLDLQAQLSAGGLSFSNPQFQSLPLLPPDGEGFLQRFINQDGLSVNNEIVLSKRLSGLISYYRGSKEEFMPRVTRDEYVYVPFTEYSLIGYLKARRSEQEEEEKQKSKTDGKTKVVSAWAEVLAIAGKKNPSSYRFRSRAACNFVFPESVKRPFPDNEFDIEEELGKDLEVLGDQEADAAMDDAASQAAEKEDMDVEEDTGVARPPVREGMSYKQRIAAAIEAIRSIGSQHLTLEPSEPGASSLEKYSPKYAEILRKIQASPGSALVYSQFRTLEGIGLFGVALEANGYIPIEIMGSDDDPYFAPATEASFRAHFTKGSNNLAEASNNLEAEDEAEDEDEAEAGTNHLLEEDARQNLVDKKGMTEVYNPVDEATHKKALEEYLKVAYPPNSKNRRELFSVNELWSKNGFDVWDVLKTSSPPTDTNIEDFRPKESIFTSSTHIEALTRYYKTVDPSKATSNHIYEIWKKYGVGIWNAIKQRRPDNITIEDFRPKGLPQTSSELEGDNSVTEVYNPVNETIHKKALLAYYKDAYPPNATQEYINTLWSKYRFGVWDAIKIKFPTDIKLEDFRPKESIFPAATHKEALTRYYKTVDPSKATQEYIDKIWTKYGFGIWNDIKEKRPTNVTIETFRPKGSEKVIAPTTGGAHAKKRYILYSGEESRERRNLLINLFNARFDRLPPRIASVLRQSGFEGPTNKKGDICNVISITGAGAEGLSLKNVRSVHVMEPFWNPVRTDQVKGRAVRICSHSELPVEDRTVEVFTYVSTVSQQMIVKKLVDESFMILDGSRTSDQFIQEISEKKKKLTNEILRVMKQSAVDCNLNSTENNTSLETIRCFIIKGGADEFLYDPRIDDDIIETERSTRFTTTVGPVTATTTAAAAVAKPTTVRLTVRSIAGKQYIEKPQPDGSITLYNIKDRLFETPLGKRTLNPETGKYKTTFT